MDLFITAFVYQPEYVIEKNGQKYVAYIRAFLDTYVDYYEYKNFLVVGTTRRIEEYYGSGVCNPFVEENLVPESVTYYDEDGKIIKMENQKDNSKKDDILQDFKQEENVTISPVTQIPTKENPIQNDAKTTMYYVENNEYFASIDNGNTFSKIISKEKAAELAEKEAQDEKYQYQGWKSEFYAQGKQKIDPISGQLLYGLDEISRLYYWKEEWKKADISGKLMWQIRLFDENDPLTSLYIYVDCENGSILGAGASSD